MEATSDSGPLFVLRPLFTRESPWASGDCDFVLVSTSRLSAWTESPVPACESSCVHANADTKKSVAGGEAAMQVQLANLISLRMIFSRANVILVCHVYCDICTACTELKCDM